MFNNSSLQILHGVVRERILKIGQYLAKIRKSKWQLCMVHGVLTYLFKYQRCL